MFTFLRGGYFKWSRKPQRDVVCAGSAPAAEKAARDGANPTTENEAPSEESNTPPGSNDSNDVIEDSPGSDNSNDVTEDSPNEMNFPTSLLICGAIILLGVGAWRLVAKRKKSEEQIKAPKQGLFYVYLPPRWLF